MMRELAREINRQLLGMYNNEITGILSFCDEQSILMIGANRFKCDLLSAETCDKVYEAYIALNLKMEDTEILIAPYLLDREEHTLSLVRKAVDDLLGMTYNITSIVGKGRNIDAYVDLITGGIHQLAILTYNKDTGNIMLSSLTVISVPDTVTPD